MYPIIESEKIFWERNLNGQNALLEKNLKKIIKFLIYCSYVIDIEIISKILLNDSYRQ